MKRFLSTSILLIILLLTACAPGGNGGKCSKGVCIKIQSAGPVKKNTSIPIVIKVKSDKNQSEMSIELLIDAGGTIEDPADKSDVTWLNNEGVAEIVWKKKMQAGKEITITQNVRVQGPGDYSLFAMAILPSGSVVSDEVVFRITEEGGTEFPADTPIPPITPAPLPTDTPGPSPTFPPTETLWPSPTVEGVTPTIPAYPAPTDMKPNEVPTNEPSSTPTSQGYPQP